MKYVSVCSDSQVALKALRVTITASHLVRLCQKALSASTRHTAGQHWVSGHAGIRRNEISDKLARDVFLFKGLLDLSLPLGGL